MNKRTYDCPCCDADVPVAESDNRVTCPECEAELEPDRDAEFLDGIWRDLSRLIEVGHRNKKAVAMKIDDFARLHNATVALKPCPCCGHEAKAVSYDYMTVTVTCTNQRCRLKVERGIVNSRTFVRCLKMVIRAWNYRKNTKMEGEE